MNRFGISTEAIEQLKSVFVQYPEINEIIVYGSRAKGTHKPGSDIDLTLVSETLTHHQLLKIANQMDDLLLPYQVDICLFRTIDNPDLIQHIQRVGIRL